MGGEIYRFEDFELDRGAYQLRHAGRVVHLERIPLDLLFLLTERHGHLLTREEILDHIWQRSLPGRGQQHQHRDPKDPSRLEGQP